MTPRNSGTPIMSAAGTPLVALIRNATICVQAIEWRMSPFAVANKSYVVNDRVAYESQLVHAVIEQESNYEPRARSKKGAKGLMQLMPETARQYGVRNSYDPKTNLDAGVRHLKDLMSRLDLPIALAAYNAGEGTVKRYGGLPPFAETQTYVRTILSRLGLPATPADTRAASN